MKSRAKGKGKTKTRIVTTYLPPELAAELDALIAAEGGSRSGWLRAAVETCLTDLEWLRATCFRKKVTLAECDLDPAEVEQQIAEMRAQHGPAPLSQHPRLEYLVRDMATGKKAIAMTACLDAELAAWVNALTLQEGVSVSALLRGTLEQYLFLRKWDEMQGYGPEGEKKPGLTDADVQRVVDELRVVRRLWGRAARSIQYNQNP